ncbi:MAG: LCP family protein [Solirubrobacteraceae bacterium]|nr:MAG: hypothetical protein DLM63_03390 [Solirubrobacterales bacterium]
MPRAEPPEYTVYRARRRFVRDEQPAGLAGLRDERGRRRRILPRRPGSGPRSTAKRVALWLLALVGAWLLLSLVLFLVSAQFEEQHEPSSTTLALDGGGKFPLTSTSNILVLGSDGRLPGTHGAGNDIIGQSTRSDTIMLIRAGVGTSARLSVPRDTLVDIPGHGMAKINAAYAIGGAPLAITTIKRYLGIKINHVVEVNFQNFPAFIDAVGGITYSGPCVVSDISGGTRLGGYSLHLRGGTHHLDGKQTLVLARTRENKCNPAENDITRVTRQQKILNAVKQSLLSLHTLIHLPWIAWDAPQTIRSDMGGPTLLALFAAMASTGSPKPRVLHPSAFVTLPDGEQALSVSDATKRAAVARFLAGG